MQNYELRIKAAPTLRRSRYFVSITIIISKERLMPSFRLSVGTRARPVQIFVFSVYILYSLKDGRLYVGQTNDLGSRLERHNKGLVRSTRYRKPFVLLRQEVYSDRAVAMKREKFLKSLYSARFKQKLVENYLKEHKNLK